MRPVTIQNVWPTRAYREWGIWHGVKNATLDGDTYTFTAKALTRRRLEAKLREKVYGE